MTVRLRLQRQGKPQRPYYRLVAIDQRAKRDGKPIEILGHYDPVPEQRIIKIERERVDYWLKQGAQVSKTVSSILKKAAKTAS
ncbi:MAG: 30S ribosomal protein S16 [Endomicrobiales bacterium]